MISFSNLENLPSFLTEDEFAKVESIIGNFRLPSYDDPPFVEGDISSDHTKGTLCP